MNILAERRHRLSNVAVGALVILGVFFVVTGEWAGSVAGGLLVAVSIAVHLLTTDNEWNADSASPNRMLALAALCIVALLIAEAVWHVWGVSEVHKAFLPHQVLTVVRRLCVGIAACASILAALEGLIGATVERRN